MTAHPAARGSRTRKDATTPTVVVPFRDTAEYRFKCQAEDTVTALRSAALDVVHELRTVGPHVEFCFIAKMPDGSERVLSVFVANGNGELIAHVTPLDAEGVMWLSTTLAKDHEQARHRTLLDAVDACRAEAVDRGAWTATTYDEVQAAYAANPRTPACEHCGR